MPEKFTVSVFTKKKGILTKKLTLNREGKIESDSKGGIVVADFEAVELSDLDDLDLFLDTLTTRQAVCYGKPVRNENLVVSKDLKKEYPEKYEKALTRTKDDFFFKGLSVLMMDYDPDPDGDEVLTPEQLRDILIDLIPDAADVEILWRPSASSCIWNVETGEELKGVRGQRLYLLVDRGERIPDVGNYLKSQLWLKGYGRIQFSSAGTMLVRSTFDISVWSPERVDYAAGAECEYPLERRPVPSILFPGKPYLTIDDGYTLTIAEREQARDMIARAKREREPEAKERRKQYAHEYALSTVGPDASEEDYQRAYDAAFRAADASILTADFILHFDNGESVTVGHILNHKQDYAGKTLADPLEPYYGGSGGNYGRNKAKLYIVGTNPYVHSFAHGGRSFRLSIVTKDIQLSAGRMNEIMQEMTKTLVNEPDLYCTDAGPVMVDTGLNGVPRIQQINNETLTCRVAALFNFYSLREVDGEQVPRPHDPPARIIQNLTKRRDRYGLRNLNGIISAPTLRPDGTVVQMPGYDDDTGLLLLYDDDMLGIPSIPESPTAKDIERAKKYLMSPFAQFDFANDLSRATMMSALLTAVVRRSLPTAPGYIVSATTAGSGKTKIAQCIEILAGGEGATNAYPSEKEELRKALTSAMLEGQPSLIYDNIDYNVRSDLLCAILSSPIHSDRILGTKDKVSLSTRMMIMMTGNNIKAVGDLSRRILKIELDPNCEHPWQRAFSFDPVLRVRQNRMTLVAAALTLLRGFIDAGRPDEVKVHTGSFEEWSRLIRNCVIWLGYVDPELSIVENFEEDHDTDHLRNLMVSWWDVFKDKMVTNNDINLLIGGIGAETAAELQFKEQVETIFHGTTAKVNAVSVGRWLGYREGRVLDGMRFKRWRNKSGRGWQLVKIEDENNFSDDFFDR